MMRWDGKAQAGIHHKKEKTKMAWSPTSDEQRQNREAGPESAAVRWTQEARKTKKKLKSNSERRFTNYGNGLGKH